MFQAMIHISGIGHALLLAQGPQKSIETIGIELNGESTKLAEALNRLLDGTNLGNPRKDDLNGADGDQGPIFLPHLDEQVPCVLKSPAPTQDKEHGVIREAGVEEPFAFAGKLEELQSPGGVPVTETKSFEDAIDEIIGNKDF